MIKFKHKSWENSFKLESSKISFLIYEDGKALWNGCTEMVNQADGKLGDFYIAKNFEEKAFEKLCTVETNLASFDLNTKKIQNAIIKKCAERAVEPEFEERLRNVSVKLYKFCKEVCIETGYSIELDENVDIGGLFKLFSISIKENFSTLLEKLIEYINVNIEFSKTKIFFFLFLTKFLAVDELKQLFQHCNYHDVFLVLIEETLPSFLKENVLPYQGLIIDKDGFEITKNFLDS